MKESFEALLLHVISMLKTSVEDYCDIETVNGRYNIIAKDGSAISIARFDGLKGITSEAEFYEMTGALSESMETYFKQRGHQLHVVFRMDDDPRERLVAATRPQHQTADNLRLDIHDLIDETVDTYTKHTHTEDCWLVFWSRPSLLDPHEISIQNKERDTFRKKHDLPAMADAQNLLKPMVFLEERHNTFVQNIVSHLASPRFTCSLELIDVREALASVRANIYPDYTSENWRPSIPWTQESDLHNAPKQERMVVRWKENGQLEDASEWLYPPLPQQIMVAGAEIGSRNQKSTNASFSMDSTIVRVGSRLYAPLVVMTPPREPQVFSTLFASLGRGGELEGGIQKPLPCTISFMLEADGMSMMTLRSLFANVLGFTSESNRNISSAHKALLEWQRDGGCIVKLRMMCMTWAPATAEGVKLIALRKRKLWKIMEGWGNPALTENSGDSLLAFQSNIPGLTAKNIGAPCPAPLPDAISMLPLLRPASPFSRGSIIYRSRDGKVLKYQKFSSEQTTWITLLAGKPGSGKSVLMNSNNVESCLSPGAKKLPWIGIIDIGISSSGFIDLIRDALPHDRQHLVLYKRLNKQVEDSINPLDTPLGQRKPLPKDRDFMKNFVTTLVTPAERMGVPLEGMSNFVGYIIDKAFSKQSDKVESAIPETYREGHSPFLDTAIKNLHDGKEITPATTYWELVDRFFDAGQLYHAELAQRFAVPTLNTLVSVASSPETKSEYGNMIIEGRPIIDSFVLGVREAVENYPCFSSYTRFDVGSARVMSIDLQDVAGGSDPDSHKQTSLMYMIARQLFMKKVAFSKEDLIKINDKYRKHYEQVVSELVDDTKILCMDEFHKTGGHQSLKNQILTDGREARKWNLEIILASQLMEDFGDLCKIATAYFVLDSGTTQTRKWMRDTIGLSDVEDTVLARYVHGASKEGASFLARFVTKNATYTQLMVATIGPARLWALSTTAEDRKLRTLLYEKMPKPVARGLLAKRFPTGSCKAYVEALRLEESADAAFDDEKVYDNIIAKIANTMYSEWLRTS
ncbi:MAG: hypothetical protein IKZ87_00850 [Actinomycetaceae bacterium]|nr:hypothetical protein [Actinomycetaceae bacterium]